MAFKLVEVEDGVTGAVAMVVGVYLLIPVMLGQFNGGLMAVDSFHHAVVASAYAEHWMSVLVPGVGGVISMATYPPLTHQLVALASFIPFVSVYSAYMAVMALAAGLLSYTVSRYVAAVTGLSMGPFPVLLVAFSPPLLVTAFVFGQLPTVLGLGFGFWAIRCLERVAMGEREDIIVPILLLTVTGFLHHFSLVLAGLVFILRVPFFIDQMDRGTFLRVGVIGGVAAAVIGLVLPEVVRMVVMGGPERAVIPHPSRSPLGSVIGGWVFLVPLLGPALLATVLPQDLRKRLGGLFVPALVLTVISLGLTTPIPEILFGEAATWITYDRFMLVTSLLVLPVFGAVIQDRPYRVLLLAVGTILSVLVVINAATLMYGTFPGTAQHTDAERAQAQQFLQEANASYRYQTAGYGVPVGDLYGQTAVPVLETGYYTGLHRDWMREVGARSLDTMGPELLETVVDRSDAVSLKYLLVFGDARSMVARQLGSASGWARSEESTELMTVWINEDVEPVEPSDREPHWRRGIVPPLTLAALLGVLVYWYRRRS